MATGAGPWLAWLLVAAVVGAAIWAFWLKVRPPRVGVPSLSVWGRVLDERRARSWWDRVRWYVSLALAALVALAVGLAAATPFRLGRASSGPTTIVLDSSWTMQTRTASGETRWQRAVGLGRALARESAGAVTLATTADGIVAGPTADLALVEMALEAVRPHGGEDVQLPRVERGGSLHVITDGASAHQLSVGTVTHSVYEPAPNVAITAFSARPGTSSRSNAEAYVEIANHAGPQRAHVTVTRETTVVSDRVIEMAAGAVVREAMPLKPEGGARLRVHVSAPANALDADDDAVAWLTDADPLDVTVVSERSDVFTRLLRDHPSIRARVIAPAAFPSGDTDVWIFDRWAPPVAPSRPVLMFEPPAASWLGASRREERTPRWGQATPHPVLDGVDPMTIDITRAWAYDGGSARSLVRSAQGTPLVSIVDSSTLRAVIVGFSFGDSNLSGSPAFPVLVGNALDWLSHPVAARPVAPGVIELPPSTSGVTAPDGQPVALTRSGVRTFARLEMPGFYFIQGGGAHSVIGVNVGDPARSNLQQSTLGASSAATTMGGLERPWWIALVVLAFAFVTIEWATWLRRITV